MKYHRPVERQTRQLHWDTVSFLRLCRKYNIYTTIKTASKEIYMWTKTSIKPFRKLTFKEVEDMGSDRMEEFVVESMIEITMLDLSNGH